MKDKYTRLILAWNARTCQKGIFMLWALPWINSSDKHCSIAEEECEDIYIRQGSRIVPFLLRAAHRMLHKTG